ncbi:MAG: AAA family ATPase, partial [Pontiella sp.]
MKILELRFKNLNSLYGEWCIDFTDPDFVADGLFAITGATGSGKTTILDALCLALYGQTPRLDRINQSQNEVMSRQTGECYSEVLFETAKGTFRANWHQQRARKKANGALQGPKREIANEQGTILATKLREVQEKVDDVVGMGFDRFTRSILLAQGSFDSFLKANADERSPILEQITGTEIYTEISKLAHQRNSAENQKLGELKAGLDGIQLLDAEALEQVQFDLKQVQDKHKEEAETRDAAKAALEREDRVQALEKALEDNRAEQETLREDNEAFKPDVERLAAARRARPLAVDHAKLVNLRDDFSKTATDLTAATDALPDLEEQQTNASSTFEEAGKWFKEQDAKQRELLPVLKQARLFDSQIAGRLTTRKTEETALEQLQDEQTALRDKEAANQAELKTIQAQQSKAETYQKEHARDAELVGQLAAIFQSLEQLKKLTGEMSAAQKAAKAAAIAAEKEAKAATEKAGKLSGARNNFTEAEAALKKISAELAPLLDGTDWRARLEELRQRIKIEQRMVESRATLAAKTTEAAGAEKELTLKRNEQESLQREQELLVENLRLQQKVESLETHREALIADQPCPLCGAREHPYAEGLPAPVIGSIEKINADLSALAK